MAQEILLDPSVTAAMTVDIRAAMDSHPVLPTENKIDHSSELTESSVWNVPDNPSK